MRLTTADWAHRFQQQARWTASLRAYLFDQVHLEKAARILEVGCGTGAVLEKLPPSPSQLQVGLDLHSGSLLYAHRQVPRVGWLAGNAFDLPFRENTFDIVFSHFLFLWLPDPLTALREMRRVAHRGASILALAEPDYGGRIDYPQALACLGEVQAHSLAGQGADPQTGRKLAGWFSAAGLLDVQSGVMGGQWPAQAAIDADWEMEWSVLASDLGASVDPHELDRLKGIDLQARKRGERILYVPTFYAVGRVP